MVVDGNEVVVVDVEDVVDPPDVEVVAREVVVLSAGVLVVSESGLSASKTKRKNTAAPTRRIPKTIIARSR